MTRPTPALEVHRFVVGPLATNCYVLVADQRALVVDPGDEAGRIQAWLETQGLEPAGILNTHAHFDHLLAVPALRDHFGVPFALHEAEKSVLQRQRAYLLEHFDYDPGEPPRPDIWLQDGQWVCVPSVGPLEVREAPNPGARFCLQVVHTPGHSPGSVCYRNEEFALVGDLIFRGSVGRTDLRGSNPDQLLASLRRILTEWPHTLRLYPGHGPETTLDQECRQNPFLLKWFPDLCSLGPG